jgi:hypothetical protein
MYSLLRFILLKQRKEQIFFFAQNKKKCLIQWLIRKIFLGEDAIEMASEGWL